MTIGRSRVVWSEQGDRLYSFEVAAQMTEPSVTLIEQCIALGLIEPVGVMLRQEEMIRMAKLRRLRRDVGKDDDTRTKIILILRRNSVV